MFGLSRLSLAASPALLPFLRSGSSGQHTAPPVGRQPIMSARDVRGKMRAGLGRRAGARPQRMRRSTVIEPRSAPVSNTRSGCSSASSDIARPDTAASQRTARSSSRCSPSATCSSSDGGCWHEAESALGRQSRLFGQADLPKSPAYPVDLSKSDRPRPDIGEAEPVDQTVPMLCAAASNRT